MERSIIPKEYSYFDTKKAISTLCAKYPFIEAKSIGRSVTGRDIVAIFVGRSIDYTVFCNGLWGADRLPTVILLMFLEELCYCLQNGKSMSGIDIRKAIFSRGVIIFPLLNPDGYDISLRGEKAAGHTKEIEKMCYGNYKNFGFNVHGIDLENNFYKKPGGTAFNKGFGGYSNFSEAETVNLAAFFRNNSVRHVVSVKNNKKGISFYDKTGRGIKMAEIMSAVTGYTINLGSKEKCFGGWFCNEFYRPFIEVSCEGFSSAELYKAYAKLKEMLTLSVLM